MKRLIDRKAWAGPLGVGRIVLLVSALWLFVTSLLALTGVPGITTAKAGYQLGASRRS